jgi:hypothetical protein
VTRLEDLTGRRFGKIKVLYKTNGGLNTIDNVQFLTVFENLAKRDMTMEEWEAFKRQINTNSDFFI